MKKKSTPPTLPLSLNFTSPSEKKKTPSVFNPPKKVTLCFLPFPSPFTVFTNLLGRQLPGWILGKTNQVVSPHMVIWSTPNFWDQPITPKYLVKLESSFTNPSDFPEIARGPVISQTIFPPFRGCFRSLIIWPVPWWKFSFQALFFLVIFGWR